jgi:hypothetical protein
MLSTFITLHYIIKDKSTGKMLIGKTTEKPPVKVGFSQDWIYWSFTGI